MTASASLRRIEGEPVERFVRLMVGIMNVDADRICMGNLTGAPTTRSKGHATESLEDSTAPKERARLPTALRPSPVGKPKNYKPRLTNTIRLLVGYFVCFPP